MVTLAVGGSSNSASLRDVLKRRLEQNRDERLWCAILPRMGE
jgi:hypothetical protein